jgi:hypothetical protein
VLTALLLVAAAQDPWTSVEREWHVRAWALAPERHQVALYEALASKTWTRRAAAYDALRRALNSGTLDEEDISLSVFEELLLRDLFDDRSAAQVHALEVLTAGWEVESGRWELEPLFSHPSPTVRAALARYAGLHGVPGDLMRDAVAAVVRESLRALAAGGWLDRGWEPEEVMLEELELLERTPVSEKLLASLLDMSRGTPREPLVRAIELRHHGDGPVDALASQWTLASGAAERGVLLRGARAARARGLTLWEALVERAAEASPDDARWLLESAFAAGDANDVLVRVRIDERFDSEAHAIAWSLLLGRDVEWDPERLEPWVRDERYAAVRHDVLQALATSRLDAHSPAGALLVLALHDADAKRVFFAANALANAPQPEVWVGAVHRAWTRWPAAEQLEFLRLLPREPVPLAFEGDLLALARAGGDARSTALELLVGFPDIGAKLAADVRAWLEEAVQATFSSGADERRERELRCTALARWLHDALGARAVPDLARTLERAGAVSDEIAKVTIRALGEGAQGRAALPPWLDPDAPERARIEAAIQLAPHGDAAALAVLTERYEHCDWELRKRALSALSGLDDERSFELLARTASDRDEEYELRNLAVDALARRGDAGVGALIEVLAGTHHPEVTRAAVRALGYAGRSSERAREQLRERLRRIEALPLEEGIGAQVELARDERDAVFSALAVAEGGLAGGELRRAWLRLPLAAADADLRARFVGRRLAAVEFRWSGELRLAGALTSAGDSLAAAGPWWRLDARLLARLADALEDPATAAEVRRAALIGLAGEGEAPDRIALELQLLRELLSNAESERNWKRFSRYAELMLRGWRSGRFSDRLWAQSAEGEYRPAAGRDPGARMESALLQARAWESLDGGDVHTARKRAARARKALGFSAAAREAQLRLEAELDAN